MDKVQAKSDGFVMWMRWIFSDEDNYKEQPSKCGQRKELDNTEENGMDQRHRAIPFHIESV